MCGLGYGVEGLQGLDFAALDVCWLRWQSSDSVTLQRCSLRPTVTERCILLLPCRPLLRVYTVQSPRQEEPRPKDPKPEDIGSHSGVLRIGF